MNQQETGRIIPNFSGNLASELVWQDGTLNGFSQAVGLKTDIVIRESDKTLKPQTVNLGEVLAWRGLANPTDIFKRGIDKDRVVEVSDSNGHGQSEVIINHLILTEQVRKGGERFSKEEYVKRLNSSVAKGLLSILAKEKLVLFGSSLAYDGINLAAAGIFGGISWSTFSGHIAGWIDSLIHLDTFDYLSARILESILGISSLTSWLEYLTSNLKRDRDFLASHRRYDLGDLYNPAKHLKKLCLR